MVVRPFGFAFALVTHFLLMFWAVAVSAAWAPPLDHRWFVVQSWEPRSYRTMGAPLFERGLSAIGWNRLVEGTRAFDGSGAGLPALDEHTRRSELAHLVCFLVAVVVAAGAVWSRWWSGAAWLVGLGVVVHLYPVMLQRLLRGRIQSLRRQRGPNLPELR
jgi:hypothetical protein